MQIHLRCRLCFSQNRPQRRLKRCSQVMEAMNYLVAIVATRGLSVRLASIAWDFRWERSTFLGARGGWEAMIRASNGLRRCRKAFANRLGADMRSCLPAPIFLLMITASLILLSWN